jgi:hypothetical protein
MEAALFVVVERGRAVLLRCIAAMIVYTRSVERSVVFFISFLFVCVEGRWGMVIFGFGVVQGGLDRLGVLRCAAHRFSVLTDVVSNVG